MPAGTDQTLRPFLWRASKLYSDTEIVSRNHDGMQRYTYGEYEQRTSQLANALDEYGIEEGDRVGTFCWNHSRHFETYFAVPSIGAQLHTINPLLPDAHIQYIVDNADDELIFVDQSLAPKLAGAVADADDEFDDIDFVVMGSESADDLEATPYESFIDGHETDYDWPDVDEEQPAGMCYTSGTTGNPKGVEYTQQMLWSHTMASQTPQGIPMADDDVVMPVVPMFHVNAWGMPFTATAGGAKQVFPGPSPEPEDLASLIENEGVTISAGVPTVWLGLMEYCTENDVDLSTLDTVIVGGSAAPKSMIEWFDTQGVEVLHAWGMTEMAPIGAVSHLKSDLQNADYDTRVEKRGKQGLVVPGLEFKVIDDDGEEIEWNGQEFGELWIRGPWVTTEYFERPEANETDFEDGWLKTGDVVTVDEDGYIKIVDREKDVIKSGGEWISSVELENAIMAHDGVAEAAVVGVPHERWQERPVAFVVPAEGADRDALVDEVNEMLADEYPKWWLPDEIEFIKEVPKTATGKFSKKDIREEYADQSLVEGQVPEDAAPDEN
ncbi:acyl-CoA synthetase (AMP-forming)/AMP-acid ligase II [Natrinema pellirubrum DSM 15624]|uniref:Acyl-CoA synthetase (AMP-forming)/AMP-acid ligase II n=2 Tax=Natrinema pellirubrum (strain DSM 15624 / CIP 106293 / JCM 10476 / NCIMB 786 / 157) TaxID=797303 RepID=L0JM92_NATP1|nr:long-chain fatty acid--CoA ligase [Natrinema pellirubrum]AGB32655.1 acyl-CoA synthetase (AMP-forming)/AMP-acid ligase II [Natrinema pellirubrum DSM 15624]